MKFGEAISACLSKYATFAGRATRSEFWWFLLFQALILLPASMLGEFVVSLVILGFVLPGLAVGTRRLHDIGKSGWWQLLSLSGLLSLVLIYWWVQPTVEGSNDYEVVSA